jgi:2-keto-3-deoxy-L-fuconate dehydrogenase
MSDRLEGRRVLVTHAERYIGPPVVELFEKEGAHVIADQSECADPAAVRDVVEQAGRIDVLVANFAGPPRMMPVTNMLTETIEFEDEDFEAYLQELVWPLLRFVRATLPQMIERRSGKIVGVTSATPLRAIPGLSVYSAARRPERVSSGGGHRGGGPQRAGQRHRPCAHREQHVLHLRDAGG